MLQHAEKFVGMGRAVRLSLALGLWAVVGVARAEESAVGELQGVVSEWVELRSTISRERQAWLDEKERLAAYLEVLTRRRDALLVEVAATVKERTSAEDQSGEMMRRQGELAALLEAFEPHVAQAEASAVRWLETIPEALREELHSAGDGTIPTTVAARLQRYLSFCAAVESGRSRIHVKRQMVETEGEQHEYAMVYLGTAQAYGVTPDGAKAVWGTFEAGQWQWQRIDAQAGDVAASLEVLDGDAPAGYLALPVRLPTAGLTAGEVSE